MISGSDLSNTPVVGCSWAITIIKHALLGKRFVVDHVGTTNVISKVNSQKTVILPNEEFLYAKYLAGNLEKQEYVDYIYSFGNTPVVINEIPLFQKWMLEENIPTVMFSNWCWIDEAITMHLLQHNIHIEPPAGPTAFISLNKRKTSYRQELLHTLASQDLIQYGYVTDNGVMPKYSYPGVKYDNDLSGLRYYPEIINTSYQGVPCSNNFINLLRISSMPGQVVLQCDTTLDFYYPGEKTFQAFALKRLPLTLGPLGFVNYLRQSGFDVYDDIIDHEYDSIVDNHARVRAAITLNKKLLSSACSVDYTQRAEKNYHHLIDVFWKVELEKFITQLKQVLSNST